MSLLDEFVKRKIILEGEAAAVVEQMEHQGLSLDEALIKRGLDEQSILQVRSEYLKIPIRDLKKNPSDAQVLRYVSEESASYYKFLPLSVSQGVIEIGMVDPENMEARDALQFIGSKLGMPFKIFLISRSDFTLAMQGYRGLSGEVERAVSDLNSSLSASEQDQLQADIQSIEDISAKPKQGQDTTNIVEDAPITKIVAVVLRHAIEGNASDIHIEFTGNEVKVRFRVDGVLHTSIVLPSGLYASVVARIKVLSNLKLDEKRKPQDGRFSAKIDGRKIDFRVSTFPTYHGEKVVMRILDSDRGVRDLDVLGLSPRNLALVREAINRPYGLILITGPTGSGKTTTLYSMLNKLDREKRNVVSLEDPVEYNMANMNQSQVVPEIGYTFASGLRSILRQDPDIIMVGEIRDRETAELAIQAALTGHLVFSTLHTNSAVGVVPRLVDMGVDPYLIAPTLILAVAQRLVRVICPESKKAVPIDPALQMMIDKQFADLPKEYLAEVPIGENLYEAASSAECPSGTRGRIAVYEMFKIDSEMELTILKNPTEPEIKRVARKAGMLSMKEDAIVKCAEGLVPFTEVNYL